VIAAARVPWAFFRRDMRIETSYKAGFVLRVGGALVTVAVFFFISRVFGDAAGAKLERYGGNYFAFALIGIALTEYVGQGIGGLGVSIRESQTTGTLELMLLSPTRMTNILLSSSLWIYASATMSVVTYIVAGALLGVDFSVANIPAAILALALTLVSYSGLGVLAAALVILIKRGNPLGWLIRGGSIVLGGVFYPTDVLPQALQVVAQALPVTHSLDVLRRTVLLGEGLDQVAGGLLALVLLSAIYIPLGLLAFAGAVRIARTDGSLGHY
jgi:ABC-2 type transport system permease protein